LGYIGIVQHKEHSPEVLSIPPGTPCIYTVGILRNKMNAFKLTTADIQNMCFM